MSDTLHFSLVSPARELFSGEVDHVIAPGSEGEFGVLPQHAPFMTTLKTGLVRVLRSGESDMRIYVRGGFADVTPMGLTILAEEAVDLATVSAADLDTEITELQGRLDAHTPGDGRNEELSERIAYLESLRTLAVS